MSSFHPTIVSDKFTPTVNFYEDYFGFVPAIEEEGYTVLCKDDGCNERIAVCAADHERLKGLVQPVQGLILNIAVDDVKSKYDSLYMEGLDIFREMGTDIFGRQNFIVYDPNGVLVNVHEAVSLKPAMNS